MAGSVNLTTPATLPTPATQADAEASDDGRTPSSESFNVRPSLVNTVHDGLRASATVVGDAASAFGVRGGEDGIEVSGGQLLAVGGATVGGNGIAAAVNAMKANSSLGLSSAQTWGRGVEAFANNGLKLTPTLISAVAGPAIADGVTFIAPDLVPKHTRSVKRGSDEEMKIKIGRAIAGGAAIGLVAAGVWLLKPDLFKRVGVKGESFFFGGMNEAMKGSTELLIKNGDDVAKHVLTGQITAGAAREALVRSGAQLADDATVTIGRVVKPMARDAAFSNRVLVGAAGGVATLALASKAAGAEDSDEARKWGIAAAATGAATLGGVAAMGKLTEAIRPLQGNQMFWKPNLDWVKSFGKKIAPITAIPAGTSASQYYNVVEDFDNITSTRSPFRRARV